MIPILYAKNAFDFESNGIGHLKDAISCEVTEERNGSYTLTLQYPIKGAWYNNITEGSIIKAKANETSALQLFRVYKSSKPLKGVVTFYADHISYDLKGVPFRPFSLTSTTPGAALTAGFAASILPHRFSAWSDISTLNNIEMKVPRSLRNLCGGSSGSVLDVWGGELEFDNFLVKLHKNRGANRGVVINYGKNLTDAKQERNIRECYTHFCPYAIKKSDKKDATGKIIGSNEETIMLSEEVLELIDPDVIGHSKTYTLDISDLFVDDEAINEANLRTHAKEYIEANQLGVPTVNITLSLMQIWESPEYAHAANFERIMLCDTVTVRFSDLGTDAEAKVIKTVYDSIAEHFKKIEVGDAKSTLSDTVKGIKGSVFEANKNLAQSKNAAAVDLQNAILDATRKITGNSGGHVVLYPANNPQEILIMDKPDITTASKVWRWNSSGLGYSSNGYNGKYGLAMTMDGKIVADFITAGTLKAIDITGCTITGGTLNINDKFTVDAKGNAHTEGEVIATGGKIGGWTITKYGIQNTYNGLTSGFEVNHNTTNALAIGSTDEENWNSAPFRVTHAGKMYATDAEISGKITAKAGGKIGGWTITKYGIQNTYNGLTSGFEVNHNTTNALAIGSTDAENWFSAPFRVTHAGEVFATKGGIGGWTLEKYSDSIKLLYAKGSDGVSCGMAAVTYETDPVFWAGYTPTGDWAHPWARGNDPSTGSKELWEDYCNFVVKRNGSIVAKSGVIGSGTNAWNIGTNYMYCGTTDEIPKTYPWTSDSNNTYLGTNGLFFDYGGSHAGNYKYTTLVSSGYVVTCGDPNASGSAYRGTAMMPNGINFHYFGSKHPNSTTMNNTDYIVGRIYVDKEGKPFIDGRFRVNRFDMRGGYDADGNANGISFYGYDSNTLTYTWGGSIEPKYTDNQHMVAYYGKHSFRQGLYVIGTGVDHDEGVDDGIFWCDAHAEFFKTADFNKTVYFLENADVHFNGDMYKNGSGIHTSDRNKKNSIQLQPSIYSKLFDKLKPVIFKYNYGKSDRYHTGLIAQDVEDALQELGIDSKDFATLCYKMDENGSKTDYGIRYGELISMCIYEIQKLKQKVFN